MITGSIVVYNRDNINHRTVYVKSKWFDDCLYYSFIDNGDFLKISKLRHEITKKAMKIVNKKFGFLSDLPVGEFRIDEDESNEDVIYIYYKEQLNNV